jgi:hypothetical protein
LFILAIVIAQLAADVVARTDTAVRSAFGFLYALPRDTAGAEMGAWVLDTTATTAEPDASGVWHIVVTQLVDTGRALSLRELVGEPGTSPAELAAAAAAMRRLEAKISKAEAEASIAITVRLNPPVVTPPASPDGARQTRPSIAGALWARRVAGHATRVTDRELELDYERWSPATLHVQFSNVAVTAEGNEGMIDRVLKETRWDVLAAIAK